MDFVMSYELATKSKKHHGGRSLLELNDEKFLDVLKFLTEELVSSQFHIFQLLHCFFV